MFEEAPLQDHAEPADMSRVFNLMRIVVGLLALAVAVWLAFGSYEAARRAAEAASVVRSEGTGIAEERDQVLAERNTLIAQLEELRAEKGVSGLTGAGLTRLDDYLAAIEEQTDTLRVAVVTATPPTPEQLLKQLNAIRGTADEARKYLQASAAPPVPGAAPPDNGTPALTPSSWQPSEAPARLIKANLAQAPAPAAQALPEEQANPGPGKEREAKLKAAQSRLYVELGVLGILGLAFLAATATLFLTRNERRHAFAGDTIKTLMGFFLGAAGVLALAG